MPNISLTHNRDRKKWGETPDSEWRGILISVVIHWPWKSMRHFPLIQMVIGPDHVSLLGFAQDALCLIAIKREENNHCIKKNQFQCVSFKIHI